MPTLKNVSAGELSFPRGTLTLAPDQSENVSEEALSIPGVQSWIQDGKAELADTEDKDKLEDDPLADLKAQATELGIDVDGRWGAEKLQSEIDKALAK